MAVHSRVRYGDFMAQHTDSVSNAPGTFRDRVAKITRDLIQIDTTNYGGNDSRGEPEAAAYCAKIMDSMGMKPETVESVPGRASVVGRMTGWDADAPALVLHGHLDVVPADPSEWICRRSEEHTSELQSRGHLVCHLLLEKKKTNSMYNINLTQILTTAKQINTPT